MPSEARKPVCPLSSPIFQGEGALSDDVGIGSVDEILTGLELASTTKPKAPVIPPLTIRHMRDTWEDLRSSLTVPPVPGRLADVHAELRRVARRETRTLRPVPAVVASGAIRARVELGQAQVHGC